MRRVDENEDSTGGSGWEEDTHAEREREAGGEGGGGIVYDSRN